MTGLNMRIAFKLRMEDQEVQFYTYKEGELIISPVSTPTQILRCDSYSVGHEAEEIDNEVIVTASKINWKKDSNDGTIAVTWESEGPIPVGDSVGAEKFLMQVKECCSQLSQQIIVESDKSEIVCFQMKLFADLNTLYRNFLKNDIIMIAQLDFQFNDFFGVCPGKFQEKLLTTVYENTDDLVFMD